MAALDLFIRPAADDIHPISRAALLALDAAERTQRLDEQQAAIRSRLAAAPGTRDWHNQVGMIVAELRRAGHALSRDGETHSWVGESGQLGVSFCRAGNTVLAWQA
ncbi:hypothetical protein ASC89_07175 [Devosia sp. Root413D1]|uniref:hypothetical protein n=1 Tax=unclassified Devosia TaxID=196773 RepID=UPI0006F46DC6|nr:MULTISPECIES: hypothetical protein [unclassified Devosia]KQU96304.1 hypothetical protein ASC68_13020 [Devosia sp. Root105]KQW81586.1 hypothetical protein ASC89_07175 [Devosia sp. Root413D1]